ncbi:MAG: hypothetical protein AB1397_07405 [bacterium]
MKKYKEAISQTNQVLKLCARTGFKLYEPEAELILAKAYLFQKDRDKAKNFANSIYKKAKEMGYHSPEIKAGQLLEKMDYLLKVPSIL